MSNAAQRNKVIATLVLVECLYVVDDCGTNFMSVAERCSLYGGFLVEREDFWDENISLLFGGTLFFL